ncbi:unnamed protein product [Somion occarium]|uniref:Uncharacterized protein n=1 Tax=Somion occarium TaxID=3059160 RepID=A0ABP1CU42_9APHY
MKIEHCPRPILQDAVLTQLYHVVRHRGVDYTGSDINLALEAFKRALAVQPQILAEPPFPRIAPYLWSFYIETWRSPIGSDRQLEPEEERRVPARMRTRTFWTMRSVPLSPVPKTSDFQDTQDVKRKNNMGRCSPE